MEIKKIKVNGETALKLTGNLVSSEVASLDHEITELLKMTTHVILDFASVDYMASAGIRVLLSTKNKLVASNGKLTIYHANDVVQNVLDMTGISAFIEMID